MRADGRGETIRKIWRRTIGENHDERNAEMAKGGQVLLQYLDIDDIVSIFRQQLDCLSNQDDSERIVAGC